MSSETRTLSIIAYVCKNALCLAYPVYLRMRLHVLFFAHYSSLSLIRYNNIHVKNLAHSPACLSHLRFNDVSAIALFTTPVSNFEYFCARLLQEADVLFGCVSLSGLLAFF